MLQKGDEGKGEMAVVTGPLVPAVYSCEVRKNNTRHDPGLGAHSGVLGYTGCAWTGCASMDGYQVGCKAVAGVGDVIVVSLGMSSPSAM